MPSTLKEITGRIVHSSWFQRSIILTIVLAGVLAGIETDAATVATHGPVLRTLDAIVLGIFITEVLLKITASCPRPWNYFRDGWNVFDFVIVVLCLMPMDSPRCSLVTRYLLVGQRSQFTQNVCAVWSPMSQISATRERSKPMFLARARALNTLNFPNSDFSRQHLAKLNPSVGLESFR